MVQLATWSGRVAAGEAVVLQLLGELDARDAWAQTGVLSCAQTRAITRVATPADEAEWVELARHTTAAQLEKTTRGVDRCRQDPTPQHEQPESASVSWGDDGYVLLQLRISPAHAPGVLARLEDARAAEQHDRDRLYADLAADLAAVGRSRGSVRAPVRRAVRLPRAGLPRAAGAPRPVRPAQHR